MKSKFLDTKVSGFPSVKLHSETCFGTINKVPLLSSIWGAQYTNERISHLARQTDAYYKSFKQDLQAAVLLAEEKYLRNPQNPSRVILLANYGILIRMHISGLLMDNPNNKGDMHLKIPRVESKVNGLRHGSFSQVKTHWRKDKRKLMCGDSHHGLYAIDYKYMANELKDEDLYEHPVSLVIEYYTPEGFNTDVNLTNDVYNLSLAEKMTDKTTGLGLWMGQFKKASMRYVGLKYNSFFYSSILALMLYFKEESENHGDAPNIDYVTCYKQYKQKNQVEKCLDHPAHLIGEYSPYLLKKVVDAYTTTMKIISEARKLMTSAEHKRKISQATGLPILIMCDMLNPEHNRKLIRGRKQTTISKIIVKNMNDLSLVITRLTQGGGISVNTDLVFQLLNY